MQQLSGQDASFLYQEAPEMPLHIGAITIRGQRTLPGGIRGLKGILGEVAPERAPAAIEAAVRSGLDELAEDADEDHDGLRSLLRGRLPVPRNLRPLLEVC